ncbi:MAG TPA: hypothetical protein DEA96_13625 [Leptospiraceae bacterium]|nr:hypothetical protein [Spirochaetaceae bacterium]HBS06001.1 hypothetical protein [Leptospiraceae bacterium]|tara:strand:- start:864 stop:1811 length:948 start_codon:yes stop_codon:yes gene_type:complete
MIGEEKKDRNLPQPLDEMEDILQDLGQVLENENLIWTTEGQTRPEHFDFSGMADLLRSAFHNASTDYSESSTVSSAGGRTDSASEDRQKNLSAGRKPGPPANLQLAANQKCTLCSDRIYATRRFYIQGRKPVLVVHFEGPFGKQTEARDRSQKLYFASEQEDDLFRRMVERMGLSMEDLHFQQLPACHFVSETSTADDWNERTLNCLTHLEDTIKRESIKLALITGPAAVLLFGEEGAKQFSESGEVIQMPVLSQQIGAVVVRSPAALLSLEGRTRKAQASGDDASYKTAREQEIKVKKQILSSLEKAFSLPELT